LTSSPPCCATFAAVTRRWSWICSI
jgi:hypothetical protein